MLKIYLYLLSLIFIPSYIFAAENEILNENLSPNKPLHNEKAIQLSSLKSEKTVLEINHPITEEEMKQLQDPVLREIYLKTFFVGYEENGYFVKKYALSVSSETISTNVEILSLRSCWLTDKCLEKIGELPHLKSLDLLGNHLTDESIPFIAHLKELRSLSLVFNMHITNVSLPILLSMPNLQELDILLNKKIDEEGGKIILQHGKKIKVNVKGTSISDKTQIEINKKNI